MTLAELEIKRDALITKIASATTRLQAGDKSIDYATITEMKKALQILDAEISRVSGAGSYRQVYIRTGTGY